MQRDSFTLVTLLIDLEKEERLASKRRDGLTKEKKPE
jgi:hypothetical protein